MICQFNRGCFRRDLEAFIQRWRYNSKDNFKEKGNSNQVQKFCSKDPVWKTKKHDRILLRCHHFFVAATTSPTGTRPLSVKHRELTDTSRKTLIVIILAVASTHIFWTPLLAGKILVASHKFWTPHQYRLGLLRPSVANERNLPCVLWKIAYGPRKWLCGGGPGGLQHGHNANREKETNVCKILTYVFPSGTVTTIPHGHTTWVVCIHFVTLHIIQSFLLFWSIADTCATLIVCR
jgi:hypothetical protein